VTVTVISSAAAMMSSAGAPRGRRFSAFRRADRQSAAAIVDTFADASDRARLVRLPSDRPP
jgi:hypothetical protein